MILIHHHHYPFPYIISNPFYIGIIYLDFIIDYQIMYSSNEKSNWKDIRDYFSLTPTTYNSIYWNRIIFGLYWVLLINYTIRSDEISLIFPQWVIILSNSLAIDVIIFIIIPIKLSYQHRIQINVILFLFYRILTKLCKEY